MLLFAGDGESSSTGAARGGEWGHVRTRSELAALINEAANIKEEPVDTDNNRMETGEDDGEVEFVRTMDGLLDGGAGYMGDMDDERAEALMDEEEEVSVVDDEEEEGEEDEEGDEVMGEARQEGGGEDAEQRSAGQNPDAAAAAAAAAVSAAAAAHDAGEVADRGEDEVTGEYGPENIPDPDIPDPEGNSDSDAPVDVVEPEPIRV